MYHILAGKITGVLLEIGNSALLHVLESLGLITLFYG